VEAEFTDINRSTGSLLLNLIHRNPVRAALVSWNETNLPVAVALLANSGGGERGVSKQKADPASDKNQDRTCFSERG